MIGVGVKSMDRWTARAAARGSMAVRQDRPPPAAA